MTLTQGSTLKPLHTHSVLQATETLQEVLGKGCLQQVQAWVPFVEQCPFRRPQDRKRTEVLALEEAPWNEQWLKGSASAVWTLNSVLHFCQFSEANMFFLNIQAILMVSFHIYLDDFLGCYQIWYTFILEGCICLKFSQCVFIKKTKGKQEYFTKQVTK